MAEFSIRAASLAKFQALFRAGWMSFFPAEAVRLSLEVTLCGVWLRDRDGQIVGKARMAGDGGHVLQLNDIAKRLDRQGQGQGQGQGLGGWIVDCLRYCCGETLPRGRDLSLIADPGAERLSARHGFKARQGMARQAP